MDLQTWCYHREPCLPRVRQEKSHSKPTEFSRPVTKERYTGSHIRSQEHSAKAYHLGSSQRNWFPPRRECLRKPSQVKGPQLLSPGSWEVTRMAHSLCSRKDRWKWGWPLRRNNRKVGFGFVYVCVLLSVQRNRTNKQSQNPIFPDNTCGPRKKVKNTWVKNISSAKKIRDGQWRSPPCDSSSFLQKAQTMF